MWMTIVLGTLLFILEVINVVFIFKNKKSNIFRTSFKVTMFLIIYTFIMCVIILIAKNSIEDMIPILIICIPLSFRNIKINNEELVYTDSISYNKEISKEEENLFMKAGIRFNKDNREKAIKWKKNLNMLYSELNKSRGIVDNYVKSITFVIVSTLLLSLGYVIVLFNGFPINLTLFNVLLIKLLIIVTNRYIYPKIPFDTDLMDRDSRVVNKLYNKQEIFLMLFQLLFMIFGLSIPFMYFMASGISYNICVLIMIITYLYMLLFYVFMMLTEKILLKNILYLFKNIYLIIYTLLIVGSSLLLNKFFKVVDVQDYMACIIVSLISIIFYDFIKFARYTTIRKRDKDAVKNNKKNK